VATATKSVSKTSFVREFLKGNPQGNLKAVNEAWTAAGMKGSISKSVVDKTRAKLGLTGNLGAKTKAAPKRKAAPAKAKAATSTPGKTSFVKEFLNDHPEGTTRKVNEAWTAAGMKGTISPTVVNKTRALLGLSGSRRAKSKPRSAVQGKPAAKKPKANTATLGKTSFVKNFLNDNPQANARGVNEAWQAAGMKGTISHPVISVVRKQLGLTGNQRGKTKQKGTQAKARTGEARAVFSETRGSSNRNGDQKQDRTTILLAVESEIDRLIFTIMGLGELPEIETALRDARRKVYRAIPS
jgi:hypothetical protein